MASDERPNDINTFDWWHLAGHWNLDWPIERWEFEWAHSNGREFYSISPQLTSDDTVPHCRDASLCVLSNWGHERQHPFWKKHILIVECYGDAPFSIYLLDNRRSILLAGLGLNLFIASSMFSCTDGGPLEFGGLTAPLEGVEFEIFELFLMGFRRWNVHLKFVPMYEKFNRYRFIAKKHRPTITNKKISRVITVKVRCAWNVCRQLQFDSKCHRSTYQFCDNNFSLSALCESKSIHWTCIERRCHCRCQNVI